MRSITAAALVLGAALSPGALAQSLTAVTLQKTHLFGQASPSAIQACQGPGGCRFLFDARVTGQNVGGLAAPVLSGPIDTAGLGSLWNNGRLSYLPASDAWDLTYLTTTQADLDAKFPGGSYALLVNGTSVPLTVGTTPPNPPILTFTGGEWSDGPYVVDARNALTITSNAYAGYGSHVDDGISVNLDTLDGVRVATTTQWFSASPGSNSLSLTVPAGTLTNGQDYWAGIVFHAHIDHPAVPALPGLWIDSKVESQTNVSIKARATQLFPLTVTSNITPTVSNATATFQPRPQDVGTTASVYVFAVAPSTVVMNASAAKTTGLSWTAKGATADTPVQCLLAQLNSSGQLQAVSASNLAAYVTGTLGAQGQSVSLLANVPTPNIAGATFYLGYGTSAQQMIASGVNQRALSVAATTVRCDPEAPQTGWWWNTTEGGRGYSIELSGNTLLFASYLYDVSGRSTWLLSSGHTSVDGSLFTSQLESYAGGQTLSGSYKAPNPVVYGGALTLAFSDAKHGTMVWPGGTVPIERFNIVPNGITMSPMNNQPESGWWWNPSESGRGYFLEWQGGELFMAGYMYDDAGSPIWHLSSNTSPSSNLQSYTNTWWQYANGQTLTGAYKPATQVNNNVGPVSITFQGAENAIMTLPGGRTTAIRRFRF